jgi:hypothetical protein
VTKSKVFINSQGIVEVQVVGILTYALVMTIGEEIKQHLQTAAEQHKPCVVLNDLTQLGMIDSSARRAVIQLAHTLPYKKAVMLSDGSPMVRYPMKYLLQAIGMRKKIKYFENRDEAVKWLFN